MADQIETRVAVLEQIARDTAAVLGRLDQRMDRMETEMRTAFGDLRAELRELRREHRNDTWRLLTVYLAGFAALLGVMAHGFHWL